MMYTLSPVCLALLLEMTLTSRLQAALHVKDEWRKMISLNTNLLFFFVKCEGTYYGGGADWITYKLA
jgi:hypothetical protein